MPRPRPTTLAQMSLKFIAVMPFSHTRGDVFSVGSFKKTKPTFLETGCARTVYTNGRKGGSCCDLQIDLGMGTNPRDHFPCRTSVWPSPVAPLLSIKQGCWVARSRPGALVPGTSTLNLL